MLFLIFRKEPEETYHKVDELTDESEDCSVFRSKQPGESLNHPFAKYFSSVDYKLVFQRNPKEKEVLLSKNDNYTGIYRCKQTTRLT